MTLLLTAVTGEGIVMAADSALTWSEAGDVVTLTSFPKIIPVPRLHMGISVAGSAVIGSRGNWISPWLQQFVSDVSDAKTVQGLGLELVDLLNDPTVASGRNHIFTMAAWTPRPDGTGNSVLVPQAYQISNEDGPYQLISLIDDAFRSEIARWRAARKDPYPIRVVATGGTPEYRKWVIYEAKQLHTRLIGGQIPLANVASVAEYVRFLIRTFGDLHKIAGRPAIVSEPVDTLLLFPDLVNMVQMRQ